MFLNTFQTPLISLFSSTGTEPLALWRTHTDNALPSDSFVCLLHDASSEPLPPPPAQLVVLETPSKSTGSTNQRASSQGLLNNTVVHIQAPSPRSTFIRCPNQSDVSLGLKAPWLCVQVRPLDKPWAIEVGMVDYAGRVGCVRCATYQNAAEVKKTNPPLLVIPLRLPERTPESLTEWRTLILHLPKMMSYFSSPALHSDADTTVPAMSCAELPQSAFAYTSYVKIYATCRIRRVWFSERPPGDREPWECGLYGD